MNNARFSILQGRAVKDRRISDAQFRTLAALGMYTDEDGWCWPSLTTLGNQLGKKKQVVGRDIIALRKLGYLEVYPRYKPDGSRTTNKYRLKFDLPPLEVVNPSPSEGDAPSPSEGYTPSPSEGDKNDPMNDPKNRRSSMKKRGDLVDAILNMASPKELAEKEATAEFEAALGFGELPWFTGGSTWDRLRRFVTKVYGEDKSVFRSYSAWRNGKGKFVAMSNKQIRQSPQMFIDTGYPEFVASQQPVEVEPSGHLL